MQHSAFTACLLAGLACGLLPGLQACAGRPPVTVLTATLPGAEAELEAMPEGVPVLLDLTLRPPLVPAIRAGAGADLAEAGCSFGVIGAASVTIPTGSPHLLIEADLTDPASSLMTCEYDPSLLGSDVPGVWRLRGCFLPRAVAVPTALSWHLAPMPPAACGIGN